MPQCAHRAVTEPDTLCRIGLSPTPRASIGRPPWCRPDGAQAPGLALNRGPRTGLLGAHAAPPLPERSTRCSGRLPRPQDSDAPAAAQARARSSSSDRSSIRVSTTRSAKAESARSPGTRPRTSRLRAARRSLARALLRCCLKAGIAGPWPPRRTGATLHPVTPCRLGTGILPRHRRRRSPAHRRQLVRYPRPGR